MTRLGLPRALATLLVVAGSLWLAPTPAAQRPASPPASSYAALMAEGQKAYGARQWSAAATAFQAMVDLARAEHNELWTARGLLGLGRVAYHQARYADARAALREAVDIARRLGAFLETAMAEDSLGALDEVSGGAKPDAAGHYERAAAAYDAAGNAAAKAQATFNALRVSNGSLEDSLPSLEALYQAATALGDRQLTGAVLHLWGDRLFAGGAYEAAIEKLDQAISILQQDPPGQELATTYTSLGRLYRLHGQLQAALALQLKALAINEKQGSAIALVQSLNAVAVTYESVGDIARAQAYYERALALANTAASPAVRSFVRANYGSLLASTGLDQARGRELLAASLPDTGRDLLAMRYQELAEIDLGLHRVDEASDEIARALTACDAALTRFDCVRARLVRARLDLARGDDRAALADNDTALAEIEAAHAQLAADDFLKQGFEELWAPAYSVGIELHMRHEEFSAGLALAERARSRALLDLLASRDVHLGQPAASATLTTRGVRTASLRSDVSAESATTAQLQATAARLHSTLLLYWVADGKIFIWALAPNATLHAATVAVSRRRLDALIRATSAFGDDPAPRGAATPTRGDQSIALVMKPQAVWRDLYDLLIQPIARYLPAAPGSRLTIVPHGPLINAPFAALKDPRGRYLIERFAIHSLTAGALLDYTHRRANARSGQMLLVADPANPPRIPGEPPLARLPGAVAEVHDIEQLLPRARTTVLEAENATEPRVITASAGQSVLHFATHAVPREVDPLSSFLALGRPADGSASGQLTAEKIYGLKLDASLVVLSACRSGEGAPTGDGVAALARAFFYAGADSLIVSLWDIADQPTNRLLPAFYRAWLGGADKARALRTAQLQLIADLRAGRVHVATAVGDVTVPEDPAFWASFVLLGDPE